MGSFNSFMKDNPMRIIYTRHFPPGDFHGINIMGTVFVQRRWGEFLPHEENHEMIHTYQQWELTYPVFYTLYVLEYLVRLVQCRWNAERAYRSISSMTPMTVGVFIFLKEGSCRVLFIIFKLLDIYNIHI